MFTKGFDEAYNRALELQKLFYGEKEKYNEELKNENRDIKHLVNKINEEKIYILETLVPKYAKNMSVLERQSIKATLGEEVSSEYIIKDYNIRPIKDLLLIDCDEKSLIKNLKTPFIKMFKINKINKNLDEEAMEVQAARDEMKKISQCAKDDKVKLIKIYKLICSATNLGEEVEERFRDFIPMIQSSRLIYGDCNIEKRSYRIGNLIRCYEGIINFLVKLCETRYRRNEGERVKFIKDSVIDDNLEELYKWKESFLDI